MTRSSKRVLAACLAVVFAAWSYGAAAFITADGSLTWTLPRRAALPERTENIASFRFGPTLRASSYYRAEVDHHHPAFMVDGRTAPTLIEKWCSGLLDRRPWIEISWPEPRALETVKIWHAGAFEPPALTVRRYQISCLSAHKPSPTLRVTANAQPIAVHALACPEARGLRIDWTPNAPGELVRVYEVEAWGR